MNPYANTCACWKCPSSSPPSQGGHKSYLSHITYNNLIMKNKILKIMLLRIAPPSWGGGLFFLFFTSPIWMKKEKHARKNMFWPPGFQPSGGPPLLAAPATIKYVRTTYISASSSIGKSTYLTILWLRYLSASSGIDKIISMKWLSRYVLKYRKPIRNIFYIRLQRWRYGNVYESIYDIITICASGGNGKFRFEN